MKPIVYEFINRRGEPVTGLRPHDIHIGRMVSVEEQEDRIVATFRVKTGTVAA